MIKKQHLLSIAYILSIQATCYAGTMGELAPTYDFDGFYAGLGTGFATLLMRDHYGFSFDRFPELTQNTTIHSTNTAVLFEGHLGYGRFVKPKTYLGAKAAINYSPIQNLARATEVIPHENYLNIATNFNQISMQPVYNIQAILGYEMYPHLLPFIEGGVSFANVQSRDFKQHTLSNLSTATNTTYVSTLNSSGYKTGYNVGLGASYQLTSHWFFSSELLYTDLGTQRASDTITMPPIASTETTTTQRKFQWVSLLASVSYLLPA